MEIKNDLPSLVGESVVIQPLVREHTSKDDEAERSTGLHLLLILSVLSITEQSGSEADLLHLVSCEVNCVEEHRQSDDIPYCQEDCGGLKQG